MCTRVFAVLTCVYARGDQRPMPCVLPVTFCFISLTLGVSLIPEFPIRLDWLVREFPGSSRLHLPVLSYAQLFLKVPEIRTQVFVHGQQALSLQSRLLDTPFIKRHFPD